MISFPFNAEAIYFLQSFSSPLFDFFFKNITRFGNPVVWLAISAMFYWIGKEKTSMYLTNLMLFSAMTVEVLKLYFASPRPAIVLGNKIRVIDAESFSRYSFPSGHATLMGAVFSYYASNKKIMLTLWLLLLVFLVALSRIYLGMHFLGDVVAGIFLGLIIGQFNKHVSAKLDKAKLQLSRFKEEFLILVAFIASIIVLAVSQSYTISALFFGYYVGFFMLKETEYTCSNISKKQLIAKFLIGFAFVGLFTFIALKSVEQNFIISYLMFLILGLWVTLLYPLLFEKLILKLLPKV